MRGETDLPQRKNRRATSNDTDGVLARLINPKQRLKHVNTVSDSKSERTISGSKTGVKTRLYLSKYEN